MTQAQRAGRLLTSYGITNQVFRSPAGLTERGCSYAVRVRSEQLDRAAGILRANQINPVKVAAV